MLANNLEEDMIATTFATAVGDNDRSRCEAYLYDHTTIVATATVGKSTIYVLRTDADCRDRAEYLSRYQAGRLGSGLYGTRDCLTGTAAAQAVQQFVSDGIERNYVVTVSDDGKLRKQTA